ncbi:outer membrane beta-barrel protein [Pedobacter aquatilis]|uniref:outer membrane beta-barrel protein n=1 Tax=Pedobacter aquatilis TaxID=351343 RepID=UPI00292F3633|nr:outer membrane beta-barrel protein [Pedobacter aquatilis]
MKKQLLITMMAVLCLSATAIAQTKGTNALSFGVNVNSSKSIFNNVEQSESKYNLFTLGYGYFFKDNSKIGLELTYGENKISGNSMQTYGYKNYGGNLSYQKYFPLFKTLYAYAGGKGSYIHGTQTNPQNTSPIEYKGNTYSLGAYGGITWFLSKRFALETSLLSADVAYSSSETTDMAFSSTSKSKQTSFNLSSQGFINNLGFKIYILF